MAQVLAAVPTAELEAVLVAVKLVIESGALSAEHVLVRLNVCALPETVQTTLQLVDAPLANTGRYDSLRSLNEAPSGAAEVNHAYVTATLKELRLHGMASAWTDLMGQGESATATSR